MGLFDRAKRWLGLDAAEAEAPPEGPSAPEPLRRPGSDERGAARERALARLGRRDRGQRPRLPDEVAPSDGRSVEDVLSAREAGRRDEARAILREIDRGRGLRTLLRAACALEAGDDDELVPLLEALATDEPRWRTELQVAAALGDDALAAPHIDRARALGAPGWAEAWARALSGDEATRRAGLVELLFADHALARTVAARDLQVSGAVADPDAASRYTSFAHGRDCIRRFGAATVGAVLDRGAARRPRLDRPAPEQS